MKGLGDSDGDKGINLSLLGEQDYAKVLRLVTLCKAMRVFLGKGDFAYVRWYRHPSQSSNYSGERDSGVGRAQSLFLGSGLQCFYGSPKNVAFSSSFPSSIFFPWPVVDPVTDSS